MTDEADLSKSLNDPHADALSTEVSIRGQLDDSGLTVAARSRATAALDRLVGGLVGIPGAWAESFRRRAEARGRHREEMQDVQQAAELSKFRLGVDLERAAWEQRVADDMRKLTNREAVSQEAILAIAQMPQLADVAAEKQDPTIDQDWMNYFASYAEKASAESVRQIWGRILAGQIIEPGKFSLTALRILAEIDPDTSATFQEVVRLRIAPDMLLPPVSLAGKHLMDLIGLESIGLVRAATAPLLQRFDEEFPVWLMDFGAVALRAFEVPPVTLQWPFMPITAAGQQIASILPWDQEAAARRLASRLPGKFAVELCTVVGRNDKQFVTVHKEVLRQKPEV